MKLYTYKRTAQFAPEAGVLRDGKLVPFAAFGLKYASMNDLIRGASPEELKTLASGAFDAARAVPLDAVTVLAPIPEPAQDVLCLGLNYMAHANEARSFSAAFASKEGWPVYFSKRVNCAPGDGEGIPAHEDLTEQLDYEVELAVIIGRDAKNVTMEEARSYVFGYTIVNDVTARDLQNRHVQWYFGKSLDGFNPMGPCIVTADEFAFPPALRISSSVNGELRQDATTDLLIHSIAKIISQFSQGATLKAGTIIATGTPKGVAMGMEKPRFLKKGDVVTCEIEGIGTLTNTIV
ncbi:MAG: fumarylacetoacetate hydrolase family protein [Firmicutes bacterium]|nr:fumarylacetoacetate hydrolase family protein [Bacillota bacterium]